jgi:cytochrome c biogenesis protein CcmG/thiol:disulfide interchange protein DsbE
LKHKAVILLIILVLGIAAAFFLLKHDESSEVMRIGKIVPDIELVDNNHNTVRLSELRGSVLLINVWASWCGPCIDELPSIENLFRHFSGNPQFKFISILFKDDRKSAQVYMEKNNYTFPVYINPDGSMVKKLRITGVPETFIIDKKGILRDKVIGPEEWDSPTVIEALKGLIKEN